MKPALKKLRVFDFDDTLAVSDSAIHIINAAGKKIGSLGAHEFNTYNLKNGETLDFRDFDKLIKPKVITPVMNILKNVVAKGGRDVYVLTGRGADKPVEEWLLSFGISVDVIPCGKLSNNSKDLARVKKEWIETQIKTHGYNYVEVFEDSKPNLAAMATLKTAYPNVVFVLRDIGHFAAKMKTQLEWGGELMRFNTWRD